MAARAAWLHFVGGLTQSEVAKRLDVPPTRAHRYIARAQADGLVRVFVDVSSSECVTYENALIEAYGLTTCRVAMEVLKNQPAMGHLIRSGKWEQIYATIETHRASGMLTLERHLIELAESGKITQQSAMAAANTRAVHAAFGMPY